MSIGYPGFTERNATSMLIWGEAECVESSVNQGSYGQTGNIAEVYA